MGGPSQTDTGVTAHSPSLQERPFLSFSGLCLEKPRSPSPFFEVWLTGHPPHRCATLPTSDWRKAGLSFPCSQQQKAPSSSLPLSIPPNVPLLCSVALLSLKVPASEEDLSFNRNLLSFFSVTILIMALTDGALTPCQTPQACEAGPVVISILQMRKCSRLGGGEGGQTYPCSSYVFKWKDS